MDKDLKVATVSLAKFLNALVKEGNPDDAASLYSFNDQVTLLNSFTRRLTRLEEGYNCEQLMPVRFVPLLPNIARNEPVREDQADPLILADAFAFQS